ncbi:efflux RND transporter permease subunit [Paraneptunicella aestuarii]|uniref:efflux RND transporter permease subunit n=1 Tax=Paraneptunicella aestuarii TaxID=2831148 RepID=UPI001E4E6F80|nr:efflux RND transporter permease subunit [Paraneptunicella aestuarii]UAA40533.1 efflux RND transporter permease subunit [Paraneptunicella aestuarii]
MSIVDISVKRPVTIWMFTFAVLLFGMVSLSRLSINLLPELTYPTLTIRTEYTGAAPGEVEQLVSKPIEEAIGVVKGVRDVKSISKAGQSDVIMSFEWGTEMDMASLDVREKLDVLRLPLDVTKPLLLRFNPNMDPIMRFGLGAVLTEADNSNSKSDNDVPTEFASLSIDGLKKLREFAEEQLKRKLESVEGVASVKIGGGLEKEIQVLIDQQKTSQLNISIEQIVNRLKEENVNTAGGRLQDGSQEYLVRTLNQFKTLRDMGDVFIATRNGKHIKLSDIAEIQDSYKERSSINRFNGLEGVEIAIYKEGDANTVQVAENIRKRLEKIQPDIPKQYQLQIVSDQSTFIASAIDEVKSAAIIGGILAMIVLYFFLKNIWSTLIISISIPVSVVATFNLMYRNDISLNIMSLGGIALAIGLLVDNSIVVLENIDRHKKQRPDEVDAAASGTKEVSTAIIASTLTTIAVFFPLVFVDGIAGQLFSDQALTVTFALAASLLVALSIIPMMSAAAIRAKQPDTLDLGPSRNKGKPTSKLGLIAYYVLFVPKYLILAVFYYLPLAITTVITTLFRILKKVFGILLRPALVAFDALYNSLENLYQSALKRSLNNRIAIMSGIVLLALASLLFIPRLGIELIPDMSQGEFHVEINMPTGSPLEHTDEVLAGLAKYTNALPNVDRSFSLAGTGSLMNASPAQGGDHWGKLSVVMKDGSAPEDELATKAAMREYLRTQPGVQAKFGKSELFSFSTPLEIELIGYDLNVLSRYGEKLVEKLQANDRFADVKSSLQSGNPELRIHFDHAKLAQLGLSAPTVSKLIAAKVGGENASKYSIEDRKIDILVRTQEEQRDSQADIAQIIVNPGATRPITLDAVASIETAIGPSEITRVGQERVAIISANLAYGDLGEAVSVVKQIIPELQLPGSMSARVTGQNEEMEVSFQSLKFALILAVFMVYLVMASQFESLLHPFLILFTVPLACAGSIYGLYLSGTTVSVVVFIGLIMLAGIVVNNAIVLVDRINQNREAGVEKAQAILEAAQSRLRPILMTTLTTTLGLLPMLMGLGDGAELRKPMAVTVIFGLLFATMLTLFLIPILYSLFDRKHYVSTPDSVPGNNVDGYSNGEQEA